MERLAEQIVDWHNRHPLARRITADSVHTIGVVALPFVRATAQAGGFVEPVLTDAVSAFDALAGTPPVSRWAVWSQRLKDLPRLLSRRPRTQWRAFNEKFLPGLSPARIEQFALAHGFAEPPAAPESRPWRVIVIDERRANAHSGWPFELYLMSAGIDVGESRTRVLAGRGIPSQIIGRRLWDPKRVGIAAGTLAVLVAVAAWLLWPQRAAEPVAPPVPVAASAPIEMPQPASAAVPVPASQPEAAAAPVPAASLPEPGDAASSEPPPDIRPRLVQRADGKVLPPMLGGKAPEKATEKPAEKAAEKPPDTAAEKKAADGVADKASAAVSAKAEPADPRLARLAQAPGAVAVALVGPPGSKAEAEALLKKMQAGLAGVHSNPQALQADVIQTPEGWRATIWPFPSREQAQLVNATLVARGLKTKAVNF
ncbi:hypothetical protein J2X16_004613 [Pelomonas aquatica]|uniref:SPOR domain-containing protein n=1 Tax=Pelomonas aquatica TaxID=431058 RepID=A0ABU1ZF36_9BURK|nr:hypothetical protein [Pelomonas aquatica]MDR7299245.1 hypothetical protein [Pelomonas aquatica]